MSDKMKIVIVDDNEARRNQIKEYMPQYADTYCTTYGDSAKKLIRPEPSGRVTDMVLMNADDVKGHGLYMFDWMKNEEKNLELDRIPVILFVSDIFSERALSFLEIEDAVFYEGELDSKKVYSTMMKTFERIEFGLDIDDQPLLYSEEKSIDKVSGLLLKPVGEDENTIKRSIILTEEEQRQHLEQALARGQQRTEEIKELVFSALRMKEEMKAREASMNTPVFSAPGVNNGIGSMNMGVMSFGQTMPQQMQPQMSQIPMPQMQAQQIPQQQMSQIPMPQMQRPASEKKTVVIVDADVNTLKSCELFLGNQYQVVLLESGMRAIDYFVKSHADILLVSYNMPVLDGFKILSSVRWHPNGKNVPTVFLAEGDTTELAKQCQQAGVMGLLPKPVSQSSLLGIIESVFSRYQRK